MGIDLIQCRDWSILSQ